MDNLNYSYNGGNKLLSVSDSSGNTTGFKDVSGTDYAYDLNGNMISDNNKGISSINYNHLNLPTKVSSASQYASIDYTYDATGTKLKKYVSGMNITPTTTEYAGNYIYENGIFQFFSHSEGYVKLENGSFDYVYQYKDHLGNIRLSYSDSNNNGRIEIAANTGGNYTEIVEESNYYPFGLKHVGYNDATTANGNSVAQRWKFEGVELEEALGYDSYEMDFRHYNPALGRFNSIDPMAEERNWLNPYNFVQNNPILRVDPSGLLDDYGLDTETGELIFIKETDDDTDTIYTGTTTYDEQGNKMFNKDGKSSKTIAKNTSNIKEITTTKDENGNTVSNGESAGMEGLIFSEGNLQLGLEVMVFISFESEIELSAWGFESDKGQGLYISPWFNNTATRSFDDVSDLYDNVITGKSKDLGKKLGHVHTHPLGGLDPSDQDRFRRNTNKNKNYPHYINILNYGWLPY